VLPPDEQRRLEDLQSSFASQISECRDEIDRLDTKQSFNNQQVIEVVKALEAMRPDPIDSKVIESVQSLEGARSCISIFFQLLFESKLSMNDVLKDLDLKESENHNLTVKLE